MPTKLPEPGDPRTLYVLDLSGYVFRAYHAVAPLSNSKGEPTHATFGVANMLNRLVRERRPYYLAVAMDSKSEFSLRKKVYAEYKATRPPAPADLSQQMVRCRELAEAYAIPILHADGYEADDLIAACVREARAHGLRTVICSADKDLMQLVHDDDVIMWDGMRNRIYGAAEVKEKWGVAPEQVRDLLALMGDTSDNVPGVSGIGEKTAAKLVSEYASLDGVYKNLDKLKGKLKENLEREEVHARLSYELVGLSDEIPIDLSLDTLRYGGWDAARLKSLLLDLEFQRLAEAVTVDAAAVLAVVAAVSTAANDTLADGETPLAPMAPVVTRPPTHYQTVLTHAALTRVVSACDAAHRVAVDLVTTSREPARATLVGVSLSWAPGEAAYVPFAHRVIGDPPQLAREDVLGVLAALFTDPTVEVIAHNVKFADAVLTAAKAPPARFAFDTMVGSYLIEPERVHNLPDVVNAEMGLAVSTVESLERREKGRVITLDEVDIATVAARSCEQVDLIGQLALRLTPRIEADAPLSKLLHDVELPLAHVLAQVEMTGVKVDVKLLATLGDELTVELERLEKELHELAGRAFNVNSPRQLETILFDELNLPTKKRTKTARSTDHEVLEELGEIHPIANKILEQRQLAKLKGTYVDALPTWVNPTTGRIHTSYDQAVAATGRLSSNNPNLQNIPIRSERGGRIREAFVARDGWWIFDADYSQIELRVLAHLSHDPILVDAFQKNEDIHTRTAMEIYKLPAEQITKAMRGQAKTTNFAVLYGQGESALARALGLKRTEAAKFIEQYFKTFPALTNFLEQTVARAREEQEVRTLLGRRRPLPLLRSANRVLRAQAERIAKNTPIQGTAADIMKLAMVSVARRLDREKLAARMILTVHDELVFEVPDAERAQVETLVRETMESAIELDVPLVVGTGWGRNWGEAH